MAPIQPIQEITIIIMIKVSKINHRGQERLKLDFPYNTAIADKIKQIGNAAWSQTHRAWHIPFKEEAIKNYRSYFMILICLFFLKADHYYEIHKKFKCI